MCGHASKMFYDAWSRLTPLSWREAVEGVYETLDDGFEGMLGHRLTAELYPDDLAACSLSSSTAELTQMSVNQVTDGVNTQSVAAASLPVLREERGTKKTQYAR